MAPASSLLRDQFLAKVWIFRFFQSDPQFWHGKNIWHRYRIKTAIIYAKTYIITALLGLGIMTTGADHGLLLGSITQKFHRDIHF